MHLFKPACVLFLLSVLTLRGVGPLDATDAQAQQAAPPPPGQSAAPPPAPPDDEIDPFGGSEIELAAARAIADLERRRRTEESKISISGVRNLGNFEYRLVGRTEDEVMKTAALMALKNAAGRLYFEDYFLRGVDRLEPYLAVYGDRFIARRTVIAKRALSKELREFHVRVSVNMDRLYGDLEEKRFLAKPKLSPAVVVTLGETIDGEASSDERARKMLEEEMRIRELRTESAKMAAFGLATDVSTDEEALALARDEAQRWDIDIIVTGRLETRNIGNKIVLFDQVFFNEGQLDLKLIRADTGEVLRTYSSKYSASGATLEEAQTRLLEALIPTAAQTLTQNFFAHWIDLMLDRSDFRLLIAEVDDQDLANFTARLKALSPNLEVYLKSHYGKVAVLNVRYPDALPGQIERFLRGSRTPLFRIRSSDGRRFVVEVI